MKPILIYTRQESARNSFVVDKFKKELGVKLVEPNYRGDAEFVINRTNDYKIAEFFEKKGIRVFNPSEFSHLANDKQACYDFMQSKGIEIMPTRYNTPPFVKKPKNGHGGQGVVMCLDKNEYDDNFVCQKPATDLGKDLRVWVVGGKIIASILRQSQSDFRSNYCLGGSASVYNLSDDERNLINKIISLVNGDYYAVDFVFNNGKIVFNELEDTVGARMLYDKTDIDILSIYCEYIKRNITF
jgi:ribosomal protein S6--L-glutamate ligase/gamma-F420-2:alpha-L-glutamate ligase